MVPTRNWIAAEYCSGLICASFIHLKPLIERLFPDILGRSSEGSKRSRPAAQKPARIGELPIEPVATLKRRLDPHVQLNTTAIRANTMREGELFDGGIKVTRDVFVTFEPYPRLAIPAKILHRPVIHSKARIVSPPSSPMSSHA